MKKPALCWNIYNINLHTFVKCYQKCCIRETSTLVHVRYASSFHPKPVCYFPAAKYSYWNEVHV